jgi:hypothetical protein
MTPAAGTAALGLGKEWPEEIACSYVFTIWFAR